MQFAMAVANYFDHGAYTYCAANKTALVFINTYVPARCGCAGTL